MVDHDEIAHLLRRRMMAMADRFESREKAREACMVILREHYGDEIPPAATEAIDMILEVLER